MVEQLPSESDVSRGELNTVIGEREHKDSGLNHDSSSLRADPAQTAVRVTAERVHSPELSEMGSITIEELKTAMYADAKVQVQVLPLLCEILEATVAENSERICDLVPGLQDFEGDFLPVSVTSYVKRIHKYGCSSSSCALIIGIMYLERLKVTHQKLRLTWINVQRLLLITTMVASKMFDDFYYSNFHWAKIGGISLEEINRLELDFLFAIKFNTNVQRDEYKAFILSLVENIDEIEGGLLSFLKDSSHTPVSTPPLPPSGSAPAPASSTVSSCGLAFQPEQVPQGPSM